MLWVQCRWSVRTADRTSLAYELELRGSLAQAHYQGEIAEGKERTFPYV